MNDLDTLGRSAARALRGSVPDVVPRRPAPSRLTRAVAAAAVVLALLVGGIAALNQEGSTGVSAGTPGIPRLVVRDVPDGLEVSGASDLPIEEFNGVDLDLWLYGTDDLAPDLLVLAIEPPAQTATTAAIEADPYREEGGVRTLTVDGGRRRYDLSSRTLDRAGLEAAAQQLAFDGDGRPTGVPEGLPLLATVTDVLFGPVPVPVNTGAVGHAIGYQDEATGRQVAVVTVEGGRDLVLAAPQAQYPTSTRLVDVRGHEARLSSYAYGGTVLVWQEAPGVIVAMAATLSEQELLAAAASLDEADDEEWAALLTVRDDRDDDNGEVRMATTSTTVSSSGSELTGTLANGLGWSITESDGRLCVEVRDSDGVSRDCLSTEEQRGSTFVEVTNARNGEPALMWGRCPPGAVRIEAEGPAATAGTACDRYFTFDVTGSRYDEVVFRNATGQELAQLPVDN